MEGRSWLDFLAAFLLSGIFTGIGRGQTVSYSEQLLISGDSASSWSAGETSILQISGHVAIVMDNVTCGADQAVVWLTPEPNGLLAEQSAQIVLMGHAHLEAKDNHLTRTAGELLVTTIVRGAIELTAASKRSEDLSQSALFQRADAIRLAGQMPPPQPAVQPGLSLSTTSVPPPPAVGGTNAAGVVQPKGGNGSTIRFQAPLTQQMEDENGQPILVLSGGVTITQSSDNGDYLELLAHDAVLFGERTSSTQASTQPTDFAHAFTPRAAYLEGDVRMDEVPAKAKEPEQRLTADQIYFDFQTQRALLTAVVFHAIDPTTQIPVTVRAKEMQRISSDEFAARGVQFTTSKFAVPTYSIGASYAYVHEEPDKEYFNVVSKDDTFHLFGWPVFYWPGLSGTLDTKPFPLREFSSGNSSKYGVTLNTDWGLFETLGRQPPKDVDIDYRLDYFSERGPGGGLNAAYKGGFITDTADPWDFQGDFKSYIMSDKGVDDLGGLRTLVDPPGQLRGMVMWEHEHYLPDNWQVQIRAGYVSDPTFLEEYYQTQFDNNTLPYDAEFYLKRQMDTEVVSFLAETDTTNFVTTADRQQEQFDVARLPEVEYQRIGDSVVDDQMTYYSDTSLAALKFDTSGFSLQEQGFYPGLSPGYPSDGFTGTTNSIVYRGDTRQEVDWPIALGNIKVVPYVMGEVTAYSDSPEDGEQTRLYGGVGARMTTSFWRVDDSVDSDLFDLHRIRHVIEPEFNVFTSGTTVDESNLFIFDPNVDAINDITAMQVAIHQHWETMRGGPGHWQSEDILDVNVEGDFYPHSLPSALLTPTSFRGLFFPSEPQTSVPRQAINADATWHIGDDTALISDIQWNLDTHETAIAEAGIAFNRGARLSYYIGDAYIQALESQVLSFNMSYNLTEKYSFNLNQTLDFGLSRAAVTYLTVTRRFDTFAFSVSVYHDDINRVSGFNVNLFPNGSPGFSTPWRAND